MAATKQVKMTELRRGEHFHVTSRGRVVAELAPPAASHAEVAEARARLRGSVLRYERPFEPVIDPGEWDINR